jgi:hypothetical protein
MESLPFPTGTKLIEKPWWLAISSPDRRLHRVAVGRDGFFAKVAFSAKSTVGAIQRKGSLIRERLLFR